MVSFDFLTQEICHGLSMLLFSVGCQEAVNDKTLRLIDGNKTRSIT